MGDPKNQMLEAREQIARLIRSSLPAISVALLIVLALDLFYTRSWPVFTFGLFVGCVYAVANLLVLFWLIAPYFFFRENVFHVVGAVVGSLVVGGGLTFATGIFGQAWGMGYALGVASPAFFGALRSLQMYATTSKTENG